jgi:hypothetical protein
LAPIHPPLIAFSGPSMDKTIFTLKHDTDFLFIQIYVDDIIFGGSSHTLMFRFQEIMKNEFQTYMMGELILFRHSSEAKRRKAYSYIEASTRKI